MPRPQTTTQRNPKSSFFSSERVHAYHEVLHIIVVVLFPREDDTTVVVLVTAAVDDGGGRYDKNHLGWGS